MNGETLGMPSERYEGRRVRARVLELELDREAGTEYSTDFICSLEICFCSSIVIINGILNILSEGSLAAAAVLPVCYVL